MKTTEKIANAK